MLSLFGANEAIKNVYLLAHPFLEKKAGVSESDLKTGYVKFLHKHQPNSVVEIDNIFVSDPQAEETLRRAYAASSLNDLNQTDVIGDPLTAEERENLLPVVEEGYEILCAANPRLKTVFDMVIRGIFFRKSRQGLGGGRSFGGSSSTAIGVIWLSGQGNPSARDFAELLLHELTHHLVFIDERCRPQFHYEAMIKPENYARSALLKKNRPMDKVVHSVIVGTEVLLARKTFLGEHPVMVHPETQELKDGVLRSIRDCLSLPNRDEVLTGWTQEILRRCETVLN